MARFQLTVRRMMIVVAITGIGFGAKELSRRRSYFLDRAIAASKAEIRNAEEANRIEEDIRSGREYIVSGGCEEIRDPAWLISFYRKRASVCAAFKLKYERAARYPWLPVVVDKPNLKVSD